MGIASDPARAGGLRWTLAGAAGALGLYGLNLLAGGLFPGQPLDLLFGNRNVAAVFASVLIPPALALFRTRRLPGTILAASLLALLAAQDALGAGLGLALGGLCLLPPGRARAAGLALAALAGAAAFLLLPTGWRLETTLGFRSLVWEAELRGWREAPLLGLGLGGLPLHFHRLATADFARSLFAAPRISCPYSLPMQILSESGLLGAALLLASGIALVRAWKGPRWAAWMAWTLLAQSLGSDALGDPVWLAGMAAALGLGLDLSGTRPGPPLRTAAGALLLAGALAGGGVFAHSLAQARGHWTLEAGRPEAAAAWFSRASRGLPTPLGLHARFREAWALRVQGRLPEALACYRALLAEAGPFGVTRKEAAETALQAGDPAPARAWLKGHLDFLPTDIEARILLDAADPEGADGRLQAFLALAERLPPRHHALPDGAQWRADAGDWTGAWRLFSRASRGRPGDGVLLENAAVSGLLCGKAVEALALLQEAAPGLRASLLEPGEPATPEPRGLRALLREASGDPDGARQDLDGIPDGTPWKGALAEALGR